jgi:hypothetical protein
MTATSTVAVKADTSQAVAELEKLAAAVILNQPKSGLRSTELYIAALTVADDLLLARYGHDWGLRGNLPAVAAVCSSAVGAVYVAARTWLKGRHVKATTPPT